jgi:DNA-binding transcriptional ArsR family regulator
VKIEAKAKQIAELLKILANENRLLIFCALTRQSLTVGEIAKRVPNITQPALSQHLTLLKAYGVLNCNKSGQSVTYTIADRRVLKILHVLKKYYCDTEDSGE